MKRRAKTKEEKKNKELYVYGALCMFLVSSKDVYFALRKKLNILKTIYNTSRTSARDKYYEDNVLYYNRHL